MIGVFFLKIGGKHSGEYDGNLFIGGSYDSYKDQTLFCTAKREMCEEIGLVLTKEDSPICDIPTVSENKKIEIKIKT